MRVQQLIAVSPGPGLIGAIKIAHRGGQNHKFTRDEIGVRYKEVFQSTLW